MVEERTTRHNNNNKKDNFFSYLFSSAVPCSTVSKGLSKEADVATPDKAARHLLYVGENVQVLVRYG
jgi:hypothetical protein